MGLNLDDHYCDDSHLNVAGSVIFTKAFIHDLQGILPLPDHRGDARYQSEWTPLTHIPGEISRIKNRLPFVRQGSLFLRENWRSFFFSYHPFHLGKNVL